MFVLICLTDLYRKRNKGRKNKKQVIGKIKLKMEGIGKIVVDSWWRASKNQNHHIRLLVTKAPNRGAVHFPSP
ncbi:hypothetical protein Patl1_01519 [Pistacia atlantica]|uniref:Uncharacterized protein n=1 Tax=Pistacia atlantica TaxID=434234 RepID=A0ACC1CCR3_9ROSI|nr:hypothetical protein Patl1_01519 [Pistacia atlantica]